MERFYGAFKVSWEVRHKSEGKNPNLSSSRWWSPPLSVLPIFSWDLQVICQRAFQLKSPRRVRPLLHGLPRLGTLEDMSTLLMSMGPKLLLWLRYPHGPSSA